MFYKLTVGRLSCENHASLKTQTNSLLHRKGLGKNTFADSFSSSQISRDSTSTHVCEQSFSFHHSFWCCRWCSWNASSNICGFLVSPADISLEIISAPDEASVEFQILWSSNYQTNININLSCAYGNKLWHMIIMSISLCKWLNVIINSIIVHLSAVTLVNSFYWLSLFLVFLRFLENHSGSHHPRLVRV